MGTEYTQACSCRCLVVRIICRREAIAGDGLTFGEKKRQRQSFTLVGRRDRAFGVLALSVALVPSGRRLLGSWRRGCNRDPAGCRRYNLSSAQRLCYKHWFCWSIKNYKSIRGVKGNLTFRMEPSGFLNLCWNCSFEIDVDACGHYRMAYIYETQNVRHNARLAASVTCGYMTACMDGCGAIACKTIIKGV